MLPPTDAVLEVTHLPICPTLVAIVTLEAVLNPTNDIQPFVDQLLVTEKLMVCIKPNESMAFVLLSISLQNLTLLLWCRLLITFANSLDTDQAQQNIGPDLDPNCLTL